MSAMKKVSIIIAHTDLVDVISALIDLECFEPTEPEVTLDPPELTDMLKREVVELDPFDTNFETLTALTTQYTYFITGWMPMESEGALTTMLSKYMCAWEISVPAGVEADQAPAVMKFPQMLGRLRSGGRRVFVPLSKSIGV